MVTHGGGESDHTVKEVKREIVSYTQHGWESREEEKQGHNQRSGLDNGLVAKQV